MINRTLARRLETLEVRMEPAEEPPIMEVLFIDAATKQPTERLHLKLGVPLSPEHSRIRSRTRDR